MIVGTFTMPGELLACTWSDAPFWKNVPPGFVATPLTVVALLMTPTGVVVAVTFVPAFPDAVVRVAPVKNDPCVVVVCTPAECRHQSRHCRARLPTDAVYNVGGCRAEARAGQERPWRGLHARDSVGKCRRYARHHSRARLAGDAAYGVSGGRVDPWYACLPRSGSQ